MTTQLDLQAFAREQIRPQAEVLAHSQEARTALFAQMADAGLLVASIPQEAGGSYSTYEEYAHLLSTVAWADAGVAVGVAVTNMVAETIWRYGTEQQRQRYLSAFKTGSGVPAAFALTEEHTGSDAANIRTSAVETDGGWLLNGEKYYITNAGLASVTIVIAQTDPDKGHKGLSAFFVERGTPGFDVIKEEIKLGLHVAKLVNFKLDNVRLEKQALLGEVGQGFEIAMTSLDSGRLGIAAQAVGIGQAALDEALSFSHKREAFGRPISDQQGIAFQLADMHVQLEAGRGLIRTAGEKKDSGGRYTLEAATAKLFCSEMCNALVDHCVQIHGARGYIEGHLPEKLYRDARATSIYEGTSEIQRLVIAKSLASR